MRQDWSVWMTLLCGFSLAGCARSPAEPLPPTSPGVRTAESRADVAAMLNELMASEFCDSVRGRFMPLAHTKDGLPAQGDEAVGGRWWIRDCRAQVAQGQTAIYMSGVGWAWAEGSKAFWGTSDYVYFSAAGTMVGLTDVMFDPARRVATLQFVPTATPFVWSGVTNQLEAHGSIPGQVLSILTLGLLSGSIDDSATNRAREIVAQSFARQLSSGFVLTLDVTHRQRDVHAVGQVVGPLRPFTDGIRWVVNEQEVLHARPGAVHVNGPFAPTPAAAVDFVTVSGVLQYRVECVADVATWFQPTARGLPPLLPPSLHGQNGLVSGAATRVVASSCPWYLITQPASGDVVANVRVRADVSGYPAAGL